MKIALIANDYVQQFPLENYGGIESCVENLAWGLYRKNIEFFVVTPKRSKIKDYPFKIIETELEPTIISKKTGFHFAYEVKKILQKESFDCIWSQSHWSVEPLLSLKKPIICTYHDGCLKQNGWMINSDFVKYRFISEFQFNNWVKYEWEKDKSFQCYTGLDEEEFEFEPQKQNYFLWCAGLAWGVEAKGLDLFIELAKNNKNYNFIAYGAGNSELEKYLYNLKISNFEFKGVLNRGKDHRDIFKKASKFIMPTQLLEALGRTIIESFSKGTPVIGSCNGALDELIIDNVNGKKCSSLDDYSEALTLNFDHKKIFTDSHKFSTKFEIETMLKESVNI